MKIGVFGGTFDPVHNGHILIAGEARGRLGLAEVIFVPVGQPWLRASAPVAAAEHRLEMVRRAVANESHFSVSAVDIERYGPTHTVDTIADIRRQLDEPAEVYFIMGQDSLAELPLWWHPEQLIAACRLVAIPRPGCPAPDPGALEAAIPGITQRVTLLDGPLADVSATEIRGRVARGETVAHLVPAPVADYIKQHGLYSSQ